MQELNSLVNSLTQSPQIQPMQHFGSNDDFLDQMLSSVLKSPWDPDLSGNNYFDDSKLRHHQITTPSSFNQAQQQTFAQLASTAPAQPKQRVRAPRGKATDPHSIAERLRRERIAERMKALQELVPNANKTDKASMLDEIIDYVKFLQLQVKVLSMSRLGGAAISSEGGGGGGGGDSVLTVTEQQVAKLMEEDMGSAMQYLQGKGLCLMPISLATAISTSTGATAAKDAPFPTRQEIKY